MGSFNCSDADVMIDDVSASAGWCDAPKATARAEHDAARCRRSQQHIPKSKQQRHRWIEVFRVPLPQILRVERRQSEPTSSWFQWFTGRDDVLWCDLSRIFSLTQPLRMPTSCWTRLRRTSSIVFIVTSSMLEQVLVPL